MMIETERVKATHGAALQHGISELGLNPGSEVQEKLLQYIDLLKKWNRVYNLTAIRDQGVMVSNHLLDSLSVAPHIKSGRVLDVGSGAGLPGIPLALARPELEMTLLDSNHKKAAFLRQVCAELSLANVQVISERVESWQAEQKFDCIISRAFSELSEFVALAGHLLAPSGQIAAMKGLHPYEEIQRLPAGWKIKDVYALKVPGLNVARHLVLMEAVS
jgi:16S rRNA (guanine527-N7)-methyltransferase